MGDDSTNCMSAASTAARGTCPTMHAAPGSTAPTTASARGRRCTTCSRPPPASPKGAGDGRLRGPPPRPRRRVRVGARRGTSRVGLTLAAILVVFLLALFYLTQTLGVAALNYDIDTLIAERSALEQQLQSVEGDIARWGAEPAIVKGAQQAGLDRR